MKDFDIRDYMWNIYEISNYNKLDNTRIALDMFLENVELGYARYEGASNIDYSKLSEIWNNKPESCHIHEKIIFNKVLHVSYSRLCKAWKRGDREAFNEACRVSLMMFGVKATDPDR